MALIECRHRDKEEVTTIGESRRRFLCVDCGEQTLGPDPKTCVHRSLKRIAAASMSSPGTGSVVHQWSNQWQCDECWTMLTFGEPQMTDEGEDFYGTN